MMPGIDQLKAAIKQLEGEAYTDVATIKGILQDPTLVAQTKDPTQVSYKIHERLHHLSIHVRAIKIGKALLDNYQSMNPLDCEEIMEML